MENSGAGIGGSRDREEQKTKKSGFWFRLFGKGKDARNAAPLSGAGRAGGAATSGAESAAARAAASRAAGAAFKPQAVAGLGIGSQSSAGLFSTLLSFLSSPVGILAAILGVALVAGVAAMYLTDRSSTARQYSSHFDAASVAGSGADGDGASGSRAGVPEAGMGEDEPYQAVEAGEAAESEETIGEPLGAAPSTDASQSGAESAAADKEKAAQNRLGGSMASEFANSFGKSGGLASASPSAFTMNAPGKDSSSTALPNAAAGAARTAANKASFGRLSAMKLDRGGGGSSRGARSGAGGGSRKAWQQMGKVKTAMEGAASAGGEEGAAQASATWDGTAGGGGASGGEGASGGSSSSSGASVPASADTPSMGDLSGGGAGTPLDPTLVGEVPTTDMDNPLSKIATAIAITVTAVSVLMMVMYPLIQKLKAADPFTQIPILIAVIALMGLITAGIVYLGVLAAQYFGEGQAAEGWTGVATAITLGIGVAGCWIGKPWVAGIGIVGPLVLAIAAPFITAAFGY